MHSDMLSHDHLTELIARREAIEAIMARYLAGPRQDHATEQDRAAAHRLFDVVLGGLEGSATTPALFENGAIRRHASRFGDGLSPILKDALGAEIPDAFIARCVDRYWASLRAAL